MFGRQKTRIMRLQSGSEDSLTIAGAVSTQYQRVTDRQMDGQQPICVVFFSVSDTRVSQNVFLVVVVVVVVVIIIIIIIITKYQILAENYQTFTRLMLPF